MAGWCALIFGASHQPGLHSGLEYDLVLRKAAHVAEYAILATFAGMALRTSGVAPRRALTGGLGFAVAYAVSDELHQTFVPGRTGTAVDVAIDAAGAALAWIVLSRQPQFRQEEGAHS